MKTTKIGFDCGFQICVGCPLKEYCKGKQNEQI